MNHQLSRRTFLAGAVAPGVLSLFGCKGGNSDSGKIKIGVVTNSVDDFWVICEKGAMKAGEKHGVEVIFRMPNPGDVKTQMEVVNELVRQDIKGLAVSVIDPVNQTPDLRGISKKVPLIAMDSDAEESGRLCYIGTDNYEAGKAAGRLVKECMPQGGTVYICVGFSTALNARQRFQGVVDELAGTKDAKGPKYGNYELYKGEMITDGKDNKVAQEKAGEALAQLVGQPNLCFVGLWAYNPPAILEAAKSKGLVGKVKIVGFDENNETLAAVEKGEIYATVVQDPYNFGFKSVELLAEIAKTGDKSKVPSGIVDYRIIAKEKGKDRQAAAEFAAELKKLLGK